MKLDPSTIPPRMRHLERDSRGLPIPVVVLRDDAAKPHFTINDTRVVEEILAKGCCAICGAKLGRNQWFIGGPGAAFHEHGRYIDGPMHLDCGTFALKVCPYLALAGTYNRRIEAKTLKAGSIKSKVVLKDSTVHPDQPAAFVFANTTGFERDRTTGHLIPIRPWREVQFWRGGARIDADEARRLIAADPKLPVAFETLQTWWRDS